MQSTIDKLKEKPKDQKNAVAGGIAITVVAVLLIGWGAFYLKRVLNEQPSTDESAIDFGAIRNESEDAAAFGEAPTHREDLGTSPFGESRSSLDQQ